MLNEHYFNEKLREIDGVMESIRFHNGIIDEYESKLENPDIDDYEETINNMNSMMEHVEYLKERLVSLEEEFKEICLFTTKLSLSFIVKILNDKGMRTFELINTGNEYIIASKDNEEKYTFPITDKFNLYRFIVERGALVDNHPEIKAVVEDILNRKADWYSYDDSKEMSLFQMVYAAMPANHPEMLKERPLMHPRFKEIVNDLVRTIFDYSKISKATKEDFKTVYKRIISGELNELMEKTYWFGSNVNSYDLADIISYAREYDIDLNLTRENYIVWEKLVGLLKHVDYLDKHGEMYIHENGHTQTKATEEERQAIDDIAVDVFKRDFTWREARELSRAISNMDYYTDYMFPHDIDKIKRTLNVKPRTLFDKVETDMDLKSNISKLNEEATNLVEKLLSRGDIRVLFENPVASPDDAYLRRMILANWDIDKRFKDIHLEKEKRDAICNELIKGVELSRETLSYLFDLPDYDYERQKIEHEEGLVDLACGTLMPFTKRERIKDLFDACRDAQMRFGIKSGTVGYTDINTHWLPNKDYLVSIYCEDIKPKFKRLQSQYDYLYDNARDAEFLEGAIEIYGDILVIQAFREGNKRTAKSIFNAMLLSRGIIPPVNDLHEQEKRLWLDIAYGRFERYMKAKYKLLLQTADVKRQFKEESFKEPLTLYDMEDVRQTFKN